VTVDRVNHQPYAQTALISAIRGHIFKKSKTSIATVYDEFFKSTVEELPDEKEIPMPVMALAATAVCVFIVLFVLFGLNLFRLGLRRSVRLAIWIHTGWSGYLCFRRLHISIRQEYSFPRSSRIQRSHQIPPHDGQCLHFSFVSGSFSAKSINGF
jgi:hypothetical protein